MTSTKINCLIATLLLALLFPCSAIAQISKSDYFMETSYLRNSLNPALRPDQGYLVVPVMPTIGVGAGTNFNLDKLTFKRGGERVTFMHSAVSADDFLSGISKKNYLYADVNTKLFAIGFYKGEGFWNVDLGVRVHTDISIPKSVFQLLKNGFEQDEIVKYDLSNINATANTFAELGVSYSRPFLDNALMLGVRGKYLMGVADFNLNTKHLDIAAGMEEWRSTDPRVTLAASAPGINAKYNSDGYFDGFGLRGFTIAGHGLGVDIGAVYDVKQILPILDGLKVSAAVNDIGFIAWSKNNTLDLRTPKSSGDIVITPNSYEQEGIDRSLSDIFDDVLDDLKEATNLKEDPSRGKKGRTTMLTAQLNTGVEYEILKNKLSAGLLYSARFGEYVTVNEVTVSGNYRPCHWFATSISYSAVHSKFDTFGLALHVAPSKGLNLFLASDYVIPHVSPQWIPTTSKALNVQVGISIPLGSKKSKQQQQDYDYK